MTDNTNLEGNSPFALFSGALTGTLLRLAGLAFVDAFGMWLTYQLYGNGETLFALAILIVTLGLNVIFLFENLFPYRWLAPGLALMAIMVIYPTITTVYYAFTNYSTGNLLNEVVAVDLIETKSEYRYLPDGEEYYDQISYGHPDNVYPDEEDYGENNNRYLLWLTGRDTGNTLIAEQEGEVRPLADWLAEEKVFTVEGAEFMADSASALADTATLEYDVPLGTITLGEIPAEGGEGVIYNPTSGKLTDFTGNRPQTYNAYLFQSEEGFALWLIQDDETILALPDGSVTEGEIPEVIDSYTRLSGRERTRPIVSKGQSDLLFGDPDNPIRIDLSSATRAGRFQQRYEQQDDGRMLDKLTGATYTADRGTFKLDADSVPAEAPEGVDIFPELSPGYYVYIGTDNFERLVNDERLRGPFLTIFAWTIIHAGVVVIITFSLGLALALLLNDTDIPYRKVWRSLILIPYAIPAFISTIMWQGMFDPNLGIINDVLGRIGIEQQWYNNATAARFAILAIQLWLGFPYMMLICTGSLQSIPADIYEAARVDGANAWERFRNITLPLLLVAVGPLLIASFAFNFNNFTVIELFNSGGPAIPNSSVPAGYTDILITYTYAQAFGTAGGTDYGFAGAISLFIFLIVATITIFNFRFTKSWEEISQNV